MITYQPIYDIAALCASKGLTQAVLCPGSRCAPLTLAFARHERIQTRTFSDERSAGFIAMGIAQQKKQPTILLCTSGTAAYNFSPAVAEAYFSQTPLLVFTADRPAEWIAQQDGQTIYQLEIFGKHVKKSFQLPQDYDHPDSLWAINRMVNDAINLSLQEPRGPVHINAPFREPLYPDTKETIGYSSNPRTMIEHTNPFNLAEEHKIYIKDAWPSYSKILVVSGQQDYNDQLISLINKFTNRHHVPVAGDIITNLHPVENSLRHTDVFLGQASEEVKKSLQPDLLITFGKSVLSKNLKLFLRKYAPKAHWHVQPGCVVPDPFHSITNIFETTSESFFSFLNSLTSLENFESQKQSNYNKLWEIEERRTFRNQEEFFPQNDLGELEVVNELLKFMPDGCNLHLANSMSVRYANSIGIQANKSNVKVFSNRGTSGIDGCTSTAVGHALSDDKINILITGDLAFFYDRNAFWHNYSLPNLRVLLLNNHGGVIFKMIDGPASMPESDEYFVTRQKLNAKKLCEEFEFDHLHLNSRRKIKNLFNDFFEADGRTKIMELETEIAINKSIFDNLRENKKII